MADDVAVIYHRYRPDYIRSDIMLSLQSHKLTNTLKSEPASLLTPLESKTTKRHSNCHKTSSHSFKTVCSNSTYQSSNKGGCRWQNITIIVKENARKNKRKKSNRQKGSRRPEISTKRSIRLTTDDYLKIMAKKCSTPVMHHDVDDRCQGSRRRRSDTQLNTSTPYQTKFIVNTVSLDPNTLQPEHQHVLNHPLMQAQLRIYRCQLSTAEENCCCSCNSDAMFEVMKSLYDCYKKKNCDHCNCVLCGHLAKEERRFGEARKSLASVGVETVSSKQLRKENMKKAKEAGLLTPLAGKTLEQREKILKGLAFLGLPLPEGKTLSQRQLIDKVRKELGLPPEPKSAAERKKHEEAAELGLLYPLEGKTKPEKEKLLQNFYDKGIELPEGRTPSEKSLIAKIKAGPKELSGTRSQKLAKAKAAGLLTPLAGKTPEQKEKILRGLALSGLPLPEAKTPSLKKLIDKVRKDLGLPPEPKSAAERKKYEDAANKGIIIPLEGKTKAEKEKLLQNWHDKGIELPEGRTPTEKSLIAKIKASPKELAGTRSQKLAKAKAAGLLSPLQGKTPEERENILKRLAHLGLPLPEGKTPSLKKLINKVRKELGLPPEPKSAAERKKHDEAVELGLLYPLEGKTKPEKEKLLQNFYDKGIELPEGRTPSEKSLIAKIKAGPKELSGTLSQKLAKAKAAGLLTPLAGKTPEQKEKILRGLAQSGIPLPEAKTPSLKKLIDKVRKDLGLPPEPKSAAERKKHEEAAELGLLYPLEGKTKPEKEKLLQNFYDKGIELPEGRTPSEKSLIAKIKAGPKELSGTLSQKLAKAKAVGLLTPLAGKTPEQKEKILRGLALSGIPLPEAKTPSLKKLIDKVRKDLGLPPEPKSAAERKKHEEAAELGLLYPLEGKTKPEKEKLLQKFYDKGIELPEGRTPSEKSLIAKIKAGPKELSMTRSQKLAKAKAAGLLTPLAGKTPEQKEKILRGLALSGLPLPEAKTPSLKKLIDKVRKGLGLPPEPKSAAERKKYEDAANKGIIIPLEGKTKAEKEKLLQNWHDKGIELPEGRTPTEKSLIAKIKASPKELAGTRSQKLAKAKAAGLLSPLQGKTPEERENILKQLAHLGLPLPEGKTPSLKKLINKVRKELGLPPEPKSAAERKKHDEAAELGLLYPLEGKTKPEKEKLLQNFYDKGIELPEGRTPSEKSLIAKIKAGPKELSGTLSQKLAKAKAAGLLTPLAGKTPEQKEKILRGLAQSGLPLPEGKTESEKKLIDKIAEDYKKVPSPSASVVSEKLRKAKAAGLLTTLDNKTPEQKEKILRGLATMGLPLLEGKTPSDVKLLEKVRKDLGLPPEPKNAAEREKYNKAQAAGIIKPLEGKTPDQKEKILRALADRSIPLPQGKTPSEKSLIKKILAETTFSPQQIASAKLRKATLAGLPVSLQGKTPNEKEKIFREIAMHGGPLPEGNTPSEIKLFDKVRKDLGLPPTPKTASEKDKYAKAQAAGLIVPLEGKTPEQKEKILRKLAGKNIPLPEGRTASEKSLIKKIQAEAKSISSKAKSDSEKLRKAKAAGLVSPKQLPQHLKNLDEQTAKLMTEGKGPSDECICNILTPELDIVHKIKSAGSVTPIKSTLSAREAKAKAAGLLTPLESKSPADRENILRGLVKSGLPLPEGKTPSLKALTDKIRMEMGLPPEPDTPLMKEKYKKAYAAGIITPLDTKTPAQKEKVLKKLLAAGVPLPEGRTPSEKSLIARVASKVAEETRSEKMRKAKAAGLLTPLKGKNPKEQERILKGLLQAGLPLPKGTSPSENALIKKFKDEFDAAKKSKSAALLTSVRGKSVVRTVSSEVPGRTQSAKLRKAKAAGLLTPLKGKDPKTQEKILKGLLKAGFPLPEGTTPTEKTLIKRVQGEFDAAKKARSGGLSPEGLAKTDSAKLRRAKAAGLLTPLTGKTSKEKANILKGLLKAGLPLPKGTTATEQALIKKMEAEAKREAGLPVPEGGDTRSKTKSKRMIAKGAGIQEEIQSIVKTDKCDAACGCDKKKIRFKHSYVKIRVTSPDISSFCPCPNECIPRVKAGVFTDNEGIKVTVGSVGVPSYTVQSERTNRTLIEKRHSLQLFGAIDNLIESESHLSFSLIDSDESSSSKAMVFSSNSESDVSVSDIERLLRSTIKNEFPVKQSSEQKSVSYIYRSSFAGSEDTLSSSKITPFSLYLTTSSLQSLYTNSTYAAESTLNHKDDVSFNISNFSSDTLSHSYLTKHLSSCSQSDNSAQSEETVYDTETYEPSSSTTTESRPNSMLPRKSQSYFTFLSRINVESNLVDEYNQPVNGDTSRLPMRDRKVPRDLDRDVLESIETMPSNKSLTSTSLFMVISTSGHCDVSTSLQTTDNVMHSVPSRHFYTKERPDLGLLALNMLITAKLFSKAKRDRWKLRKAKAILRVRDMAQKIKLQTQKLEKRGYSNLPQPVFKLNKYTSSTKATPEDKKMEHSPAKKAGLLPRQWFTSTGNKAAHKIKHLAQKIHSLSSPSSCYASDSSGSTTSKKHSQVFRNLRLSKIHVGNIGNVSSIRGKPRKTCTFAASAAKLEFVSTSLSVHRMKTCY